MSRRWVTCAVNSATIAEGSRGNRSPSLRRVRSATGRIARRSLRTPVRLTTTSAGSPSRQHGPVRLGKRTDPDRDLLELDEQPLQRVAKLPLDTRPAPPGRRSASPRPSRVPTRRPHRVGSGRGGWRGSVPTPRTSVPALRGRSAASFPPSPALPCAAGQQAAPEHEAESVARPDTGDPGRPAGRTLRQIPRDPLHK